MFLIFGTKVVSRGANLDHVVILLSAALQHIQESCQSAAPHPRRSQTTDGEDLTVNVLLVPLTDVSAIQIKDLNSTLVLISLYCQGR